MGQSIGVCYGTLGDDLPPPSEVVNLYKSNNFGLLRLYAPDRAMLDALRGSGIGVLLGTANEDLPRLASSIATAADWVQTNVRAYWPDVKFRHIAVGNEVIPGESAQYVLGAMWNVYDALGDDLRGVIKVSTSVSMGVMKNTYPPSQGELSDNSVAYMGPIARFLATTKAPLLLNVYPYFSYIENSKDISLNYATFTSPSAVVIDGSLSYQNIFDAMVDSVYWALEKFGAANVPIVVSETGWPSDGSWAANMDNARTYNSNLIRHVTNGTPKRPGPLETYIFAMFNENLKPGDATERHFGLFYPNKQPVYPLLPTQSAGVCYGMLGDNLPQPSEVVNLYKSNNIGLLRLYAPNQTVFDALRGSGIGVLLGTTNQDLQSLASSKDAAANWIQTNVRAYWTDVKFRHIAVGNEVIPGQFAQYVLPAMQNIYNALGDDLRGKIKVSTSVHMGVIGVSYPPSQGAFSQASMTYMGPITRFLADTGAPLLVNVYPYFSYIGNPKDISLKYATFTSPNAVVFDGPLSYQNLFDAMVDSVYSALERAGAANVPIVVSESGWPSAGSWAASLDNAGTYNSNLIRHVKTNGTPKRPGPLETYVFAMFNENKKDGDETERHFGLFYPNKQPVYPVSF